MNDFKRYFDDEIYFLKESGKQFASDYPDVGQLLEGSSAQDRDPSVERLLEGFAFLTARIRQDMDQESNSLAKELIESTQPDLLQPLPSSTLVQIQPPLTEMGNYPVYRDMPLTTGHLPDFGYACQFSIDEDRLFTSTQLTHVGIATDFAGHDCIDLHFSRNHVPITDKETICLFVNGESTFAWTLWYYLVCLVESNSTWNIKAHQTTGDQSGWSTIRSFFSMEERFRMFTIDLPPFLGELKIQLKLTQKFPEHFNKHINKGSLLTNVFPVVNRFTQGTEPVSIDHRQFEYRITPKVGRKQEILSIKSVKAGCIKKPSQFVTIPAFAHMAEEQQKSTETYYRYDSRLDRQGLATTWITLSGLAPEIDTLSIEAICCDGFQIRDFINPKDTLTAKNSKFADSVIQVLLRPTPLLRGPIHQEQSWKLLGFLTVGLNSLTEPSYLKKALSIWNWDPLNNKAFLIQAIHACQVNKKYHSYKGRLLPCLEIHVQFHDDHCRLESWDRLALYKTFGQIIKQVFQEQATPNLLIELHLEIEPCRVKFLMPPEEGLDIAL